MIFSYRSMVGLDYSENELRYVELLQSIRGLRLGGYGTVELTTDDTGITTSRRDLLVEKIRGMVDTGAIRSKRAVIGLPRENYFFRKVSLPPVSPEKLKPIIENQIERIFPIRGDQIEYDYQEIGKGRNGEREIILVGAKSSEVEEAMSIAKAAGLELLRIDMKEVAVCNLLGRKEKERWKDSLICIHLTGEAVFINLISNGHPVSCRKISMDSRTMKPERMVTEVERAFGIYGEMTRGEDELDRIVLFGEPSAIEKVTPHLEQSFRIDIEYFRPGEIGIDLPPEFDSIRLGYALGLAMSGYQISTNTIDLLPKKVKAKRWKEEWIRTGIVSFAILFLTICFFIASNWRNEARLEDVEREIAAIEGRVNSVRELKQEYEDLGKRVNTLNDLQAKKPHWLVILNNLSEAIPGDAWLTSLDMEQGEPLKISGNASSAATLIPLLEDSPYLKNVKFEAPTTTRDFGGEEVETFRITADIEWSGDNHAESE